MDRLGEILVTPEQLLQMADEWKTLLKKAAGAYEAIGIAARQTEGFFRGSSAEVFRAEIEKRTKDGIEKVNSMQEFPVRLAEIAEIYRNTEGENKDVFGRN